MTAQDRRFLFLRQRPSRAQRIRRAVLRAALVLTVTVLILASARAAAMLFTSLIWGI